MGLALRQARETLADRDPGIATGEPGFYLQFDIPVAERDAVDALESKRSAIELVAVRPPADGDEIVSATVFVPERSAEFYVRKIEEYRDEETRWGKPKHQALIARIETVRLGLVQALFTDAVESYPAKDRQVWWEVWLRDGRLGEFRPIASELGLQLKEHTLNFPERDVVLLLADEAALARLVTNTDAIAELRLAKDTPTLFLEMQPAEQADWVADLERRVAGPSRNAPAVCVLDSGAVREHPLIAPALIAADQHAYDPAWGVDDGSGPWKGHGTGMAGVALYGDLEAALTQNGPVVLRHRLETVKILPRRGRNPPELYGAITAIGITKVEEQAPRRARTFCMAVTSDIGLSRGRPSSWSATIDQLAYADGADRRLFVLAAGNIRENVTASDYPDHNDLAEAENPSQAWNALVAGAYTAKITISHPDYQGWDPVASAGDLCPTSRTSGVWDRQWPIRPDIVFEGGNQAHDGVERDALRWNNASEVHAKVEQQFRPGSIVSHLQALDLFMVGPEPGVDLSTPAPLLQLALPHQALSLRFAHAAMIACAFANDVEAAAGAIRSRSTHA